MVKNTKKGFTLIELLVVIAIIGLMASVVLASLNSARAKAANSAVKANLVGAKSEAALFYDSNGTYAGVCAVGGTNTISDNVSAALLAGGDIGYADNDTRCFGEASGWVAISRLKVAEGSGVYYCVDSSGKSSLVDPLDISHGLLSGTPNLSAGERCP